MKKVNNIELVRTLEPGGALYSVVEEKGGTFLLGLGLWDRKNCRHTTEIKDATKGQVVRIDADDNILGRSDELSNIIYQLMPLGTEKVFVGCRSGALQYLNKDLTFDRHIDFKSPGLYFWVRTGNEIVATLREGGVVFLNLLNDEAELMNVVDKNVRMWPIIRDETPEKEVYLAGSYRGHLAMIENKEVKKLIVASEKPSSVWTLNEFCGRYVVGTARGELLSFDKNLENRTLMYRNDTGITSTARLNKNQLAVGDLKGNLHIVGCDGSSIHYMHPVKEKVANTVWWITPDHENNLIRTAYSNGQMNTFRLGD